MDRRVANELYRAHAPAMACVLITDKHGDAGIGTAFHVGEGVFVTARHVVEGAVISAVQLTERLLLPPNDAFPDISPELLIKRTAALAEAGISPDVLMTQGALTLTGGPFFHPDETVDVAAFTVDGFHRRLPAVQLGRHLDDWLFQEGWVLSEAIVFGYPPIPMTTSPYLVAASGEINAVIGMRHSRCTHFIISAIPRGGFSGGLVLSEFGFALGMVTQSLVHNGAPTETGFFTVTSIEPIYQCLAEHKLLPTVQKKGWDGLWNSRAYRYTAPATGGLQVAYLRHHDDGVDIYVDCHTHKDSILADEMACTALARATDWPTKTDRKREDWIRVSFLGSAAEASELAGDAVEAVKGLLARKGLRLVG